MLVVNKYKIYLLLLLTSFIFYGNSVQNEYSIDDIFVLDNPVVKQGIKAIPEIFSTRYYKDNKYDFGYRPIAKASFAVEYSMFGIQTHLSHFINLLLYWLACCLLFRVLIEVMGASNLLFPAMVTLLFLTHPLHTEVVCSLKNRENLLSFIFSMTAMICYAKFAYKNKYHYFFGGSLAIVLGYLSKEDSMVYLFMIPFTMHFFKKADSKQLIKIILGVLLTYLLLLVVAILLYINFEEKRPYAFFENPLYYDHNIIHRISMGFYSLAYYARLLFVPYPLIVYYGYKHISIVEWNDWRVIISALMTILLIAYCLTQYKKRNVIVYGIIFFLAGISMFLNIIFPVTGIIGERYAFNASVGFCIAVTAGLFQLFKLNPLMEMNGLGGFWRNNKWMLLFIVAILTVYFKIIFSRNHEWKDVYSLSKADIVHAPNSVKIHDLLADASLQKYNAPETRKEEKEILLKQAIVNYQESLKIYPKQAEPLNNIGLVFAGVYKNYTEAIAYFGQAIAIDSTLSEAYYNTGVCYYRLMNIGDAEANYKKAIHFNSTHMQAYFDLTDLYIKTDKIDAAIELNKSGIEKGTRNADLYLNLGDIYLIKKDSANAVNFYEQSLAYRPDNKKLCKMLEGYYTGKNNREKADHYRKMAEQSK